MVSSPRCGEKMAAPSKAHSTPLGGTYRQFQHTSLRCAPLTMALHYGWLLLGQATLPVTQGGPVRFYIRLEEGTTSEVNACANVKSLRTIRLTIGPGEDTRLSR